MNEKPLEYYMNLPYRLEIYPEDGGGGYTAVIPDLPGCMTSAGTLEELEEMIREAKELWLEVALADGDYIPEPPPIEVEEYSGKFVVRLPRSLHTGLVRRAEREGTSLNQLVVLLLSEGMGRWGERGRQALEVSYRYTQEAGRPMALRDQGQVPGASPPESEAGGRQENEEAGPAQNVARPN